jgi:hypothetical protein
MTNKNIKTDTKIRILQTYVWLDLLNGYECWTIHQQYKEETGGNLRRILKTSWTDEKKSNQEMLKMANTERSLIKQYK